MTTTNALAAGAVVAATASWIAAFRVLFRYGFLVGDYDGTAQAFLVWPILSLVLGILAMVMGKRGKNVWAVLGGGAAMVAGTILLVITLQYCWMSVMF
jgi:hypothetical protein